MKSYCLIQTRLDSFKSCLLGIDLKSLYETTYFKFCQLNLKVCNQREDPCSIYLRLLSWSFHLKLKSRRKIRKKWLIKWTNKVLIQMIKNILIFSLKIWIIEIFIIQLSSQKKKSYLRVNNWGRSKNTKKKELLISLLCSTMETILLKFTKKLPSTLN